MRLPNRSHILFLLFFLFLLAWGEICYAFSPALSIFNRTPALFPTNYYYLNDALTPKNRQLHLQLANEYLYQPLEIQTTAGLERSIVTHAWSFHLAASYPLLPQLQLGIGMPVIVTEKIQQIVASQPSTKSGTGDIQIAAKWNWLQANEVQKWNIAVRPFITIPTGFERFYMSEGQVTGGIEFIAGRTFSHYSLATAMLGWQGRKLSQLGSTAFNDTFKIGIAYLFRFNSKWSLFSENWVTTNIDQFMQSQRSTNLSMQLGSRFQFHRDWKLTFTAGSTLLKLPPTPFFSMATGITWQPTFKKKAKPKPVLPPPIIKQKKEKPILKKNPKSKPKQKRFLPIL